MGKWIVDRIESEYIVLEKDEQVRNVKKEEIGFKVKEGDILIEDEDGNFTLDENETKKRTEYIEKITKDLWEN